MWWQLAAQQHNWTIDQWEKLPPRHQRFYIDLWHDEGLWETKAEKTEREAREAEQAETDEAAQFEREQLVSAQQQMNPGSNVRVGATVDASQLAPSEWPGEVIDRRTRR